jgi:glutathione-regulated potassium-efflux system ancillary protein KefC
MDAFSILPNVPFSIALAFGFGFIARLINLPPLAGFLLAGFALNAMGVPPDPAIKEIADAGVILLLFTIGLKLKVSTLARPEVWVGTTVHTVVMTTALTGVLLFLAETQLSYFAELNWASALMLAFALSFSSTVFTVKVLEGRGEMGTLHGRSAIGILIIQDIFAVTFLAIAAIEIPSPWAFALFGLILLKPILGKLLDRVGHGELVPLFGLFAAVVLGAGTFELVGIKPGLGALVLGAMMASHKRAAEVATSIFGFKEILLVAFFLDIGLSSTPALSHFAVALILLVLVPVKSGLFFLLLAGFKLRARSALLASLNLATYSEFGLIVGAAAVSNQWLSADWMVIIAIALSISFLAAAPVNARPHKIYARLHNVLRRFERQEHHPEDQPLVLGNATIAVFGMGRVGTGAYDYLRERYGGVVIGIEANAEKVRQHQREGRNVILGDAADSDFWERVRRVSRNLKVVLLAMPEHRANLYSVEQIKDGDFAGFLAVIAKFPDHVESLREAGADAAFNMYAEAGVGLAASVDEQIGKMMVVKS